MKKILVLLTALALCAGTAFGRGTQSVTFDTKLHCQNCVKKVVENISYVKGVKDLDVSLEKQQIKIVFDPAKTSVEKLSGEIRKLGYTPVVHPEEGKAEDKANKK